MTSFALKIIAILTMVIDHIGYVYYSRFPHAFYLRCIGRIAFPLYAFMVAEGCRHTKNIKKYMLRLGLFALMSEIPFDICFYGKIFYPGYQNVFFTLFLAVAAIYGYEELLKSKWKHLSFASPFVTMILAYFFKTDYSYYGIITIFLIYLSESKRMKLLAMTLGIIYINVTNIDWIISFLGYQVSAGLVLMLFSLIAVGLTALYNGKRGPALTLLFYWVYPIHMLVIHFINI